MRGLFADSDAMKSLTALGEGAFFVRSIPESPSSGLSATISPDFEGEGICRHSHFKCLSKNSNLAFSI